MPSDLVEAFMGHRAGIEQTYFLPDLESANNPEVIKKVMEEYKKAVPALTIFSDAEKIKELEARINDNVKSQAERERKFDAERAEWTQKYEVTLKMLEQSIDERIRALESSKPG